MEEKLILRHLWQWQKLDTDLMISFFSVEYGLTYDFNVLNNVLNNERSLELWRIKYFNNINLIIFITKDHQSSSFQKLMWVNALFPFDSPV